jgi:hypothetical protein
MPLETRANIADPDGFYQELIDSARSGRGPGRVDECKLVLILANHIGDREVLREALKRAAGKPG